MAVTIKKQGRVYRWTWPDGWDDPVLERLFKVWDYQDFSQDMGGELKMAQAVAEFLGEGDGSITITDDSDPGDPRRVY